jgi:hypothetical protein
MNKYSNINADELFGATDLPATFKSLGVDWFPFYNTERKAAGPVHCEYCYHCINPYQLKLHNQIAHTADPGVKLS